MANSPYEILGQDGVRHLVEAFFDSMDKLPDAAEIRAMHAPNLDDMKRKLTAYLIGWMGGPPIYEAMTGSVCLTEPHAQFVIGQRARDQWLECMRSALERIGASEELRSMLDGPLFQVAEAVRNHDDDAPTVARDPNIIAVG